MNKQQKDGFTIIEVVLVLAIAGLIFLMVFIALPALQRNQRDAARKQEVSKVAAAITSYQSNNNGKSPAIGDPFAKYIDGKYIASNTSIELTSGTEVKKSNQTSGTISRDLLNTDTIVFIVGAQCADTPGDVKSGSSRQSAVLIVLENGEAAYCQTN